MKRYILMTIEKDFKYEGFGRYYYKLFDNYLELQKHLYKFGFIEKNKYIVFEETNLKKDSSLSDVKSKRWL